MALATATAVKKTKAEPLINVAEAASRLGVTRKTVYQLIEAGQLAAVDMFHGDPLRKRKTYRIAPEEVARFIGHNTIKASAANTNGSDN